MTGRQYEATITPSPDSAVCGATACEKTELPALVDPEGKEEARTLCPWHRVEYLHEVYSQ